MDQGWTAFLALGAVVLVITGSEALYADLGHFGRRPIRRAWFGLVLPALMLNYLGQGALLLSDPSAADNPFFRLAPAWAQIPMLLLATTAAAVHGYQPQRCQPGHLLRAARGPGGVPRVKC